jgi:DNA replication and repair protein RecF
VLCARGRSHRAAADAELIRWGAPFARVEAQAAEPEAAIEVVIARDGPAAGRKRLRVNGVSRRPAALGTAIRVVLFAPEEMLLVIGSPGLRRDALDRLASDRSPVYVRALATYERALRQRNGLLKAIREEAATRAELRFWDDAFLDAGAQVLEGRADLLRALADPLAAAHREIAPEEGRLTLAYVTNAPARTDETPRDALARRLLETADKEVWNGATLVGPHRDDMAFLLDGREMQGSASRGQQRSAILALKLAELDLLERLDGRPPLLLLDDVFSELDPARRGHLVRRISALPQAFVTTTTLADLDPELRAHGTPWRVEPGEGAEQGGHDPRSETAAAGPGAGARLVEDAG